MDVPPYWVGTRRNVGFIEQHCMGHRGSKWLEITGPQWFLTRSTRSSSIVQTSFTGPINQIFQLNSCWLWKLSLIRDYTPQWRLWHWCQLWFASATQEICSHLCSDISGWDFLQPHGLPGSTVPVFPSTLKGMPAEPPLYQTGSRYLIFHNSSPPAVDPDNNEEEYFPTALLDDSVWSEEPIPDRDLCIQMPLGKSETSYPSQKKPTQLQAYIWISNPRRTNE